MILERIAGSFQGRSIEGRKHASGTGCAVGWDRLLAFVGELTNHASAGRERIENRVSPSRGKNRSNLLIDVLVCLREEARKLTLRRCSEFFHGDDKADLAASLLLFEREMV